MRATLVLAVLTISLGGCIFQNLSASRAITDQVYAFNDEIRWARIDLATERVEPDYRAEFVLAHRLWGHDIQIADADMTHVQIAEDNESATSLVTFAWYDERTMRLHNTVVQQRWAKSGDSFLLEAEEIVGGDDTLFAPPPEVEPEVEVEDATAAAGRTRG